MRTKTGQNDSAMISRLFFRLLPVQVAIVAMGSINSIVDGIVAARFCGETAVAVVGLYFTMVRILEAVGSVILGGASVLSGRYLGAGKIDKTRGVCSLAITAALISGAVLTGASFAAPEAIAGLLGANEQLKKDLATYIVGYAFGLIPLLLSQQLAACLQLERQQKRGQVGIVVMVAVNLLLDILFSVIMDMGIWGLALSTSLANWAYFLVLVQYYLTDKVQLRPGVRLIAWRELPGMLKTGFPNALLVACLAARSLVINRLLLAHAGEDGLSALSAFNMVSGLILAIALGTGAVIRMLSSVFLGEENREALLAVIRTALTKVMAMMAAVAAIVALLAPILTGIFFQDPASGVYSMTRELFVINGLSALLALLCIIYASYCQAAGFRWFVNLTSLMDGFFSVVIPAVLLSPAFGALGVWLSFPIGLCITLAVCAAYAVIRCKRWPRSLDEWLLLQPEFGTGERLVMTLRDVSGVTRTAVSVQEFCDAHGIPKKTGAHAGLCLEEMAGNIVEHGFEKDRKSHVVEIRVVILQERVVLRIKDDCIPFNPKECYEMTASGDPFANVGLRLVYGIAQDISYQNLLGLNVLTITLSDSASAHGARQ